MVLTGAVLLLINAAFDLVVWPVFLFRRVMKDPRSRDDRGEGTGFLRFNVALLGLSAVIGLLSLIFGLLLMLNPVLIAAG